MGEKSYIDRLIKAGMDQENAAEICKWFSAYSSDDLLDTYVNLYEMRKERACS